MYAANEPESSMTLAVILAAPGALLIAIIGLAAILAIFHRQRKRRRQASMATTNQTLHIDTADNDSSDEYQHSATLQRTGKNSGGKQPDLIKSKRGKELHI